MPPHLHQTNHKILFVMKRVYDLTTDDDSGEAHPTMVPVPAPLKRGRPEGSHAGLTISETDRANKKRLRARECLEYNRTRLAAIHHNDVVAGWDRGYVVGFNAGRRLNQASENAPPVVSTAATTTTGSAREEGLDENLYEKMGAVRI